LPFAPFLSLVTEKTKRVVCGAALALAIAIWGGASVAALGRVSAHAAKPGEAAHAPARWPSESRIAKTNARPTMLVFAHTRCPCTRATLRELERLVLRISARADVWVIFSGPDGGDLHESARAIPSVRVTEDAAEGRRFGVRTSGEVLLYGADDTLLFAGGITPSRGHEGDSEGAARIEELLASTNVAKAPAKASVFGCALFQGRTE
jgi:hypothetical protein